MTNNEMTLEKELEKEKEDIVKKLQKHGTKESKDLANEMLALKTKNMTNEDIDLLTDMLNSACKIIGVSMFHEKEGEIK